MEEVGGADDDHAEQRPARRCSAPSGRRACRRRTANVSRMRPMRRASTIARAGSPRRAGSVADISTPIIVAEVTSRRRTGRPGQRRAHDRAARTRRGRTSTGDHQRAGDQHPGEVGADDALGDVVHADPAGGEDGQPDADRSRRCRARARRAARRPRRRSRRAAGPGRAGAWRARARAARRGDESDAAEGAPRPVGRGLGHGLHRPLVDLGHLGRRRGPRRSARRSRAPASPIAIRRSGSWRRRWSSSASACGSAGGTSTPSRPSVTTSL